VSFIKINLSFLININVKPGVSTWKARLNYIFSFDAVLMCLVIVYVL